MKRIAIFYAAIVILALTILAIEAHPQAAPKPQSATVQIKQGDNLSKPSTATAPDTVTPKESTDTLKLELALEKEKDIQLQASALQSQAMQQIEPQVAPLRTEYAKQDEIVKDEMEKVKKAEGYGPDTNLDRNPNSPTFGKWVKAAPKK